MASIISVHQSIICDFVEGKLFRLNVETGEKEEINEIDANQPLSLQVIVDEESKTYIEPPSYSSKWGYPLALWVTKKDGTQTNQWDEVEGQYVQEKHVSNTHPLFKTFGAFQKQKDKEHEKKIQELENELEEKIKELNSFTDSKSTPTANEYLYANEAVEKGRKELALAKSWTFIPTGRYCFVLFSGRGRYISLCSPMPNKEDQKVIKFYVSTKEEALNSGTIKDAVLEKERANAMADSKTIDVALKLPNDLDWKPDFQFNLVKSHSDTEIKISWMTPCNTDDLIDQILSSQRVTSLRSVSTSHNDEAALRKTLQENKLGIEYNLEYVKVLMFYFFYSQ